MCTLIIIILDIRMEITSPIEICYTYVSYGKRIFFLFTCLVNQLSNIIADLTVLWGTAINIVNAFYMLNLCCCSSTANVNRVVVCVYFMVKQFSYLSFEVFVESKQNKQKQNEIETHLFTIHKCLFFFEII